MDPGKLGPGRTTAQYLVGVDSLKGGLDLRLHTSIPRFPVRARLTSAQPPALGTGPRLAPSERQACPAHTHPQPSCRATTSPPGLLAPSTMPTPGRSKQRAARVRPQPYHAQRTLGCDGPEQEMRTIAARVRAVLCEFVQFAVRKASLLPTTQVGLTGANADGHHIHGAQPRGVRAAHRTRKVGRTPPTHADLGFAATSSGGVRDGCVSCPRPG